MIDVGNNRISKIKSLRKGCSPNIKTLFMDGNLVIDAEKLVEMVSLKDIIIEFDETQ